MINLIAINLMGSRHLVPNTILPFVFALLVFRLFCPRPTYWTIHEVQWSIVRWIFKPPRNPHVVNDCGKLSPFWICHTDLPLFEPRLCSRYIWTSAFCSSTSAFTESSVRKLKFMYPTFSAFSSGHTAAVELSICGRHLSIYDSRYRMNT